MKITPAVALARLNDFLPDFDNGALSLYEGTPPASAGDPLTTQTTLVTFTLGAPAFDVASIQPDNSRATAVLNTPPDQPGLVDGTAQFFRFHDAAGVPLLQGSVGTSPSAELQVIDTEVKFNVMVSVVLFKLNQPVGT